MIAVRKHKGRSGRSVFEWRVYSVIEGPKTITTQLGKYRTQEAAEAAAEHHRTNQARVKALWTARHNAELDTMTSDGVE